MNKIHSDAGSGVAQLELGFAHTSAHAMRARPARAQRAAWWFQRMREAVDRAVAWAPATPARPQQIYFANTHRECSVAPVQATHSA